MNEIFINTDGSIYQDQKLISDVLNFLGYRISLDKAFTLRSFFRMLETYPVLKKMSAFIPSFIEQSASCSDNGCVYAAADFLQLGKVIEMTGFPGDPGIETYVTLQGVKENQTVDIKPLWLSSLLDMNLRLGSLKHVVFGDRIDTFSFETGFNLFEFVDGIAWTLSFHNMPAECRLKTDF